ncbi:MerR family transcriptional regulator [Clostridium botulinum]|nr:MerR family transcriptional regulator [Clostridium botulinum]NFD33930.1 MerR family transcriptional regulator [Clostridium botulinum]NFD59036.1 MerR family transcriptional regulator [Clostridium botulinum]NFE02167.1 MerR family transcriptional regulator [Clostridium botulinum]
MRTVKRVSYLTGISVRTLHYYNNKWKYGSNSFKFIEEALKFYSENSNS